MIEKVDGQIGEVLQSLRESGFDKKTVIVFVSDHGDCQGAHQWNQKTVFYEEATKVPFILSYPGFTPRKSDHLVQTGIDLIPTICEFADIPLPKQSRGESLKELITNGKSNSDRNYLVVSDHLSQGAEVNGQKPEPKDVCCEMNGLNTGFTMKEIKEKRCTICRTIRVKWLIWQVIQNIWMN